MPWRAVAPPREEPDSSIAEPAPSFRIDCDSAPSFYEILQISARADLDTIHRVYRILAARFHPGNPVSGDRERFLQLRQAYEVLSRPEWRTHYDAALQARQTRPMPIFEEPRFLDGIQRGDEPAVRGSGAVALIAERNRLVQRFENGASS